MKRQELLEELFAVNQAAQRAWKAYFFKLLSNEEISVAQTGLLFHIHHEQSITGSELAAHLQVSRSAVTQLLEGLTELKLVQREEDPTDKRVAHITLTKRGTNKVKQLEKKRKDFFVSMVESLTDEEVKTLIRIQTKMVQ